jgi:hypothetical protein
VVDRELVKKALFAFAATTLLLVGRGGDASAGWWDDLDKGERVRLADVMAQPRAWAGKRVTFTCVYHKQDQVFAPYFTRFHPGRHLNVSVWPDGSPVWEQDAFLSDFATLYLDRSHVQRDEILALPTFTRVEVTGEVRDVYRNAPWIEIHGVRKTGGTLGESVVQSMVAGDNHLRAAEPEKAEAWYRRALRDPGLDETYALRIRKRLGDLLRGTGRAEEAAQVEGGTILGGTLPPRSDGSPSPRHAPPPAEPAPALAAAPSAVSSDLPGIAVDPVATPAPAGEPPVPTAPRVEPPLARASSPASLSPRVPSAAAPAPLAPSPVARSAPSLVPVSAAPAPPRRTPRLAGVQ